MVFHRGATEVGGTVVSTCVLLLFDGCDVMDVTGPYEVLLAAGRLAARAGTPPPFDVRTVSVAGDAVTAHGGLGLVPSHGALRDQASIDVLVVPGLVDVDAGVADDELVGAVRDGAAVAGLTMSVCTGAFLLDEAGVTDGVDVTTHWEDVPDLRRRRREAGRAGAVHTDVRWVDRGTVVTAGGISSGVDAALHLVERLAGRPLAVATARQIDHAWVERAAGTE